MAASVRATCPSCGDVQFPLDNLVMVRHVETAEDTYTFRCPECGARVVNQLTDTLARLLDSYGVAMVRVFAPTLSNRPALGPITEADIADAADDLALLDKPGWESAFQS